MMMKDSVFILLLLGLCSGKVVEDSVEPIVSHVLDKEGKNVSLSCSYSSTYTGTLYLYWYRHYPGTSPHYILHKANQGSYSNEAPFAKGKFSCEVMPNSTHLYMTDVKTEDSATYVCALQAAGGGWKLIFGGGTQLIVKPRTEQTIPSVYKLKSTSSDEKLPNSVCLITDFPSPNKALEIDGNQVNLTDVAVLDASSDNKWRYSTVTWDNNKNACNGKYDEKDFFAENEPENNEETCSSISIDESFRTNPSLNTLSTTVFGWRVVAVKAIVFNLILSLRLWSS